MPGPFEIDRSPPSAELLEVAKQELRETPEVRAAAIEELRKLLSASDLSFPDDEEFLLIYLRPTKFYPESALKLVSLGLIREARCPRRWNKSLIVFTFPQKRCAMWRSLTRRTKTCCTT